MTLSVSIIGAGHSGCALAAEYKKRGFEVCLYSHENHAQRLNAIEQKGQLSSTGNVVGEWKINQLTTKIATALEFSDNIILALPSYAQDKIFPELAPHLNNQHKVINLNGNFSSYLLHDLTIDRETLIFETNSAPHASRADRDGNIHIHGTKKFIPIASTSPHISQENKDTIQKLMPCALEWHETPLSVSMQAYNGVLHPTPLILSTAWTEAQGTRYRFYKDGISPCVGKIIEKIDNERLEIAKLYGIQDLRTTLEALNEIYGGNSETICDLAQESGIYDDILAPENMCSRYITEDVPFVLVPWYHLGQAVGYEASTIKSIITMASVMHANDYMETGRTLQGLSKAISEQPMQNTLPPLKQVI